MNALRAHPLILRMQNLAFFPANLRSVSKRAKTVAHSPEHTINIVSPSLSVPLMGAQILWFGIGMTLFSDTTETILQWPHQCVVAISSGLMIASAWFGVRAMLALCALTLPAIFSVMYFSLTQAMPGSDPLALWTQMVSVKSLEYMSGFLIMMGTCIRTTSVQPSITPSAKKINVALVLACLGFVLGNILYIFSSMKASMADNQSDFLSALAEQGSTILGLCLLAFSARASSHNRLSTLGTTLCQTTKLPLRGLILVVGVLCAVISDWYSQYLVGWLQYASVLIPPLAIMLMGRFLLDKLPLLKQAASTPV